LSLDLCWRMAPHRSRRGGYLDGDVGLALYATWPVWCAQDMRKGLQSEMGSLLKIPDIISHVALAAGILISGSAPSPDLQYLQVSTVPPYIRAAHKQAIEHCHRAVRTLRVRAI
jgi:hypothetical protein